MIHFKILCGPSHGLRTASSRMADLYTQTDYGCMYSSMSYDVTVGGWRSHKTKFIFEFGAGSFVKRGPPSC
jgi:hypothetical protein